MPKQLEYGAATHVGLVRSNNEDCFLADPGLGLWLIADGMGGHDAGEVASGIVKDSVHQSIKDGQSLVDAITQSHQDVKDAAAMDIGSSNMGTTIVALQSHDSNYEVAWVGDSRAYLWNPLEHSLTQISVDHSYVQALYEAGSISEEEMENHPQKNVITQSLGVSELDAIRVDSVLGIWGCRQKIIMCSDGLSDIVNKQQIKDTIKKHHNKTDQELVDALVACALSNGGVDNVSVAVISAPHASDVAKIMAPSSVVIKTVALSLFAVALAIILFLAF